MGKGILVLGGNGFVGQAFCQTAVERNWRVCSLSRSGAPKNPLSRNLLDRVSWHKGSALDPTSFTKNNILDDVDYIVHSIGILMPQSEHLETYHKFSVETARVAVEAAKNTKIKGIAYISAANFGKAFTSLLPGYFSSKSEAEKYLETQQKYFDKVIIARPGMMWGDGRWSTKPISLFYNIGTFFAGRLFSKALPVSSVANSVLDAFEDDSIKGFQIFEVPRLKSP
jgi:nucleoside-diphosphate-sugar epimerase